MFREALYKQIKTWKKFGYADNELKELSTERGYSEKDINDTLRYFEMEEKESFPADISKGKLVAMIAVSWATPFPGLLNIIFLWKAKGYRENAIIALVVAILFLSLPYAVTGGVLVVHLGIAIWMTVNAARAYNKSKKLRFKILNPELIEE